MSSGAKCSNERGDMITDPPTLTHSPSLYHLGVYDFFYEPGQALVSSPKDFGDAIAKGSSSLLKRSVNFFFCAHVNTIHTRRACSYLSVPMHTFAKRVPL